MAARKKLLEEFWKYSENGKVIEDDFVEHFILTYSNLEGLTDYVKSVEIDYEYDCKDLAVYDEIEHFIIVYYNFLRKNSRLSVYNLSFNGKLNKQQIISYQNIIILIVLIHEICHADDNKTLRNGPYGLKTYLINAGFYLGEGCSQDIKDISYEYCPLERLANIGATEKSKSFLEPVVKELPYLKGFAEFEFLKELTKGYDESRRGNTVKFFKIINKLEFWCGLDFYSPDSNELLKNVKSMYSLDERLRFGLPIDNKEHANMTRLLNDRKRRC